MNTDFQFLRWDNLPQCEARMEKYFDGYHSLQLLTRGKVRLSYDEDTYHLGGTSFWFHYPGPFIKLRAEQGRSWHHRFASFRGPICDTWREAGLLAQAPLDCPTERRSELIARFDDVLRWAEEGSPAALAKAKAALEILLWEIWEIRRQPARHHSVLDSVAEFAAERRFRVGSYARLARTLGLSMSSLRRHVLEASGLPLHRYTRALRLREARRLLRQTDRNLADIAAALGFTDVYYFSREFSRLAGMPPAAYRKSEL